ncbi:hypothetical protein Fmac_001059 [Flemingia macrophylla]|uniref:HMA domain-containing protein n=1 Tax=Flemingia macrophylla TaxID=520843 RepID=A0ABD1NG06_9FABA
MGEEQKKSEEQPKAEEKTPEEPQKNEEEAKPAAEADNSIQEEKPEESKPEEVAPPPPPTEIMLKVFMHCEGCARKVRRCLKGFPGVEKVVTDCKAHMVVVKGEKADPLKVLERVQTKSHRKVELLSPIPQPEEENKAQEEEEKPEPEPKPEEKKEESPIVTVLKIHMHCEACAQEVKRRIEKMKGVESAEPDLKNSQVSVKGRYEPSKLVEYVYKRSGKHAVIIKQQQEEGEKKEEAEEEKKSDDAAAAEEKKEETKGEEGAKEETKGEGEAEGEAKVEEAAAEETASGEEVVKINEYHYNPQTYGMEVYAQPPPAVAAAQYPAYYQYYHAYPPQIFSDENPNACTIM